MLFFNHCKHQNWGLWWRANWLLLCALIRLGFWCLSSPISVPELYEWHHHVTSDSEICTFTAFLRLRLRSLSISPAPDTAPGWSRARCHPTAEPCCEHQYVTVSLHPTEYTRKLVLCFPKGPSLMHLSLQLLETLEAKAPENCWWEFGEDAPAPQCRAEVPEPL